MAAVTLLSICLTRAQTHFRNIKAPKEILTRQGQDTTEAHDDRRRGLGL